MKPEIVFLDVGGVILEIDSRRSLEPLGITDLAAQAKIWKTVSDMPAHHSFERGEICEDEFFKAVAKELQTSIPDGEIRKAWNRLVVGPLSGVELIFDTYSGKIPLIALSNTNVSHYRHIKKEFSILSRLDRFLSSFELGHRKPDAECFLAAAEEMKVKREACVLIDDNDDNIASAKRVGFQAFKSVNSPAQTLKHLAAILK